MKKDILIEIFFLEKKGQGTLEKKLDCKFNRINTSKENCDVDYDFLGYKHLLVSLKMKN